MQTDVDPDLMLHYAVSDLGLHCLSISYKKNKAYICLFSGGSGSSPSPSKVKTQETPVRVRH